MTSPVSPPMHDPLIPTPLQNTPRRDFAWSSRVCGHLVAILIEKDGAPGHDGSRPNRAWARIVIQPTRQNFGSAPAWVARSGAYNPVCDPDQLIDYRFPAPTTRWPVDSNLWWRVAHEEVEFLQQHRYFQADGKVIGSPNGGIPVILPVEPPADPID